MKLNNKGYMLVEIIISSVLAISVAYYLLDLTYQFKDKDADIYQSIVYLDDKNIITKNIMNDLERGNIGSFTTGTNYINFDLVMLDKDNKIVREKRRLEVVHGESDVTILYGLYSNGSYVKEDVSYYEKNITKSLIVGNIEVDVNDNSVGIKIPMESLYDEEDYDIKLFSSISDF